MTEKYSTERHYDYGDVNYGFYLIDTNILARLANMADSQYAVVAPDAAAERDLRMRASAAGVKDLYEGDGELAERSVVDGEEGK